MVNNLMFLEYLQLWEYALTLLSHFFLAFRELSTFRPELIKTIFGKAKQIPKSYTLRIASEPL